MDSKNLRKSFTYAVSRRDTILNLETVATCGRDKRTDKAVAFIIENLSEAFLFHFGFGGYVTFGEEESGSKDSREGCNTMLD